MDDGTKALVEGLVIPLIKDFLAPKIQQVIKSLKLDKKEVAGVELSFNDYLSIRYEKYYVLDTLVFPNKQTGFHLLYEPLTISTKRDTTLILSRVDQYPAELLENFNRIIIEDTAGMGKSTILRKIFLSAIEEKACIPILIELRHINEKNSILKEIQKQFSSNGQSMDMMLITNLLVSGELVILFDGLDEISITNRSFALLDLHDFISSFHNNFFVITSRSENSLASFGDFQRFNIKPLEEDEAFNLIERYDTYSYKKIARDLIKTLELNQEKALSEYLTNPLLVSLLYKSFDYKKDIPLKKSQFYRQVFDALFENHDLSKEGYLKRQKFSNLHLDDFDRVLRCLAYYTAIANEIEYGKDYLIHTIERVKNRLTDLTFKATDFLKDLLETVPLFKKEGSSYFWSHKSLQDYFAAKFIWIDTKATQEQILLKIYNDSLSDRFLNVLDIFYELDPKAFRRTILYWMLDDVRTHMAESYPDGLNSLDTRLLLNRREVTYGKKCGILLIPEAEKHLNASDIRDRYLPSCDLQTSAQSYYYDENDHIIGMTAIDSIPLVSTLVVLLADKIPGLISLIPHEPFGNEFSLLNRKLVRGKWYYVDDQESNILNSVELFEFVTEKFCCNYKIDFTYANKLYGLIQLEINSTEEDDLLKW